MLSELMPILLPAALPLVIPIAIMLGHRRTTGAILATGGGALAALAIFWLFLGGMSGLSGGPSSGGIISAVLLYGGCLLVIAGWTLALNATMYARQWRWAALLTVAGYAWCVAVVFIVTHPLQVMYSCGVDQSFVPICPATNPFLVQFLIPAVFLIAPAAVLAYGVLFRAKRAQSAQEQEGVTFTPGVATPVLRATAVDGDTDMDADFEMRLERI